MIEAYIFDAVRTPRGLGHSHGSLYEVRPVELLAALLRALAERLSLEPAQVDDVIIGCTSPVDDQGYNIARAGLLHAGWPDRIGGMQLHRFGASGLEAVNLAAAKVRSGWEQMIVAGGLESMSRVPAGSGGGPLLYDPELINTHTILPPGIAADLVATIEGLDRSALDDFALRSRQRARQSHEEGRFSRALIPIHDRNGLLLLENDEWLGQEEVDAETLAALEPAFGGAGFDAMALHRYPALARINHYHTAGNTAADADGAALVLIGSKARGDALGWKPRARILAAASAGTDPTPMLTGPTPAGRLALTRAKMKPKDVDLWECNECFAAEALKFQRDFGIDSDRLNVNGGAIALGHPLGATGAMLLGTLLDELERRDLATGMVAIAGNTAAIIERI